MIIELLSFIYRIVELYSAILIIYALLSWFPGAYDSTLGRWLTKLTQPYLSLFDHLNLNLGPVSFRIAFAVIVLNLAMQGLQIILLMFLR